MRDLTSNEKLRNSLLDDPAWWCQRVDHEFEYGNHLNHVPIKSTYQIKLSVTDVQKYSRCPGILNSLKIGDSIAVELPITTRRTEEMISIQVQGSANCTAFIQSQTDHSSRSSCGYTTTVYVYAIVLVGQICSITLLENRSWKRERARFGKESIKQHIPANEALFTSISVVPVSNGIAIRDYKPKNF